ncbi:MAG: UvrB/UvrC motif-containing protein [Gemmatimonadetes bacterium]|jgi:protein arginine kinase activator|nr:UvrB/UvrC motif-containing protein [Gemmatimonadota bacterium]
MRCDNCGKGDAAIHLTKIQNNEMNTYHLCETCAAEEGLDTGEPTAAAPLTDFLAQMGKNIGGETAVALGGCTSCGLTLSDFKKTGRLGCSTCYTQFDQHLRGLLRRLHGGTQHVGKIFLSPDPRQTDRLARIASLRRSLHHAVAGEDFERAAALRDQIRQLELTE